MALNITALLLVLAITFMHSIFGFFSGLINLFCTVISVVVALGFYEALNEFITGQFGLHPAYTEPICLVGLFIITIIVVRTLADNYVRGNVKVPAAVDWAGGAVCGFINAQLFVGILVLSVLMLPLGGRVIQFSRYERNPDERDFDHPDTARFDRQQLWTRSDEFAVGLFNLISGGSMRGSTAFASVYPDFCDAVFFSTNTVQAESSPSTYRDKKDGDGFEGGLKVDKWWVEKGPVDVRYREETPTRRNPTPAYKRRTFEPASGKKLIAARLVLRKPSADRQKRELRHLFRPTMLRLVGARGDNPEQYAARIIANADERIGGKHRLVDYDNNFSLPASGNVRIYAYFEVDQDFQPAFVEYRRHARAPMGPPAEESGEVQFTLRGEEERDRPRGRGRGGNLTFGRILEGRSGDSPKLPFGMVRRALQGAGTDVRLEGDKLAGGRVSGARSTLEPTTGSESTITDFWVPEGKRLLQVRYKPKEARTIAGDVFNYFGSQLNQYILVDKNAEEYPLVGYYAIVNRSRGEYIELFYAGDPDDPASVSFRAMLDFQRLDRSEINDRDDTIIGLLFVVPPRTDFVRVRNQTGEGGDLALSSHGP